MSEHKIIITINCSKRTCVGEDGKPCRCLSYIPWAVCSVFGEELTSDDQRHDGEPERCRQCLDSEQP